MNCLFIYFAHFANGALTFFLIVLEFFILDVNICYGFAAYLSVIFNLVPAVSNLV